MPMLKSATIKILNEGDPSYQHEHIGKTLYIEKDGISMKFTDDEMVQILISCGAISGDSLDYYRIEKGHGPNWPKAEQ